MCPQDDNTIGNDDVLLRRIAPNFFMANSAPPHEPILSSQAFQNLDGKFMSALLLSRLEQHGFDRSHVLDGWEGYGLVEFSVGYARQCGQIVVRDPTDEEPWHVHVVGDKGKGWRKRFKAGCTILAYPDRDT